MESFEPTETPGSSTSLLQYAFLLWKWAWLIVLAAVLAGAAAFFVSRRQTPIYQATTKIMINEAIGIKI